MGESHRSINRIRRDTSSFIRYVRNYAERNNLDIPKTAIFTSNVFRDREYEYFVNQPSKLVRDAPVRKGFFGDTSEWLVTHNAGFEIPPGYDPSNINRVKLYYQKRLFEFAQMVMDYSGSLHFSVTDFNVAYNDLFSRRYSSIHDHRIIAPLPRLILRTLQDHPQELSLPVLGKHIDWNTYEVSHLSNPTISKLGNQEMAGLQTYGTPGMNVKKGQTQKRLGWGTKLEFNLRVKDRRSFYDSNRHGIAPGWTGQAAENVAAKLTKQILTTIRLFEPEKYVGLGPVYNLERSWKSHRGICVDVSRSYYTYLTQQGNVIFKDRFDLSENQFDDFKMFFKAYGSSFDLESSGGLTPALNRLNQMYQKSNREDKIVDCFIGFETTLLRDGGSSSKIADRGTVLLKHHPNIESRYAHDLLSLLTRIRNGIVHNSAQVTDYIDSNNETSPHSTRPVEEVGPRNLLKQARSILAHIIREYAYLMDREKKSIHEINVDLLDNQIRTQ